MNHSFPIGLIISFITLCSHTHVFAIDENKNKLCRSTTDDILPTILNSMGLSRDSIKMDLLAMKKLPYNLNQMVAVIPKIIFEDETMLTIDAIILVVDTETGAIIQQYQEKNIIYGDAVYISSITIDTAPYLLTKDVRAFGIRIGYTGSSRPNPFSQEILSLYIPKDKQLIRVLDQICMNRFQGEWDTNCAGQFEETKSIITFEKESRHNHFNLVVKDVTTKTENVLTESDCVERTLERHEQKTVYYYNGKSYN